MTKEENLNLFYDTMYAGSSNAEIYSKFVHAIEESECNPVLSALIEQCQEKSEINSIRIQSQWNAKVTEQLERIADKNPYLPDVEVGEEVPALSAVAWVDGSRNADCRPKVFDGVTKTWKLCDSGSMVTVIRKSPDDKIDNSRVLQAVNGSAIKCYGTKSIEIRLGRKTYSIEAVVADVSQDILGWDFLAKYKFDWQWSDLGDLYLVDKKAQVRAQVRFVTVPAGAAMRMASLFKVAQGGPVEPNHSEVAAFELASMKSVGRQRRIRTYPTKI